MAIKWSAVNELQGNFSNLDRLNLIKVIVAYSGPSDRLSLDTMSLRSQPPLPQERLVALLGGNSLASLATGNAGTAVATLLGGTLLSPVISGLSNLFDDRITASLYPAFLEPYAEDSRNQGRVPSQLVLGAEVGVDLTDRFNFSVLTAPNRSDIPPEGGVALSGHRQAWRPRRARPTGALAGTTAAVLPLLSRLRLNGVSGLWWRCRSRTVR